MNAMSDQIKHVTNANFPEFKKLYEKAVKENQKDFIFEDTLVFTSYAKYLIEYWESKNIL